MELAGLIRRPKKLAPDVLRKARPVRNPEVVETVDGDVVTLRGPAVLKGALGRWIAKSSPRPVIKTYELEEIGAFVWSLIDGKTSFESLSKQLRAKFKMNRLEAEASLEAFLRMLADRGLVTLMVKPK